MKNDEVLYRDEIFKTKTFPNVEFTEKCIRLTKRTRYLHALYDWRSVSMLRTVCGWFPLVEVLPRRGSGGGWEKISSGGNFLVLILQGGSSPEWNSPGVTFRGATLLGGIICKPLRTLRSAVKANYRYISQTKVKRTYTLKKRILKQLFFYHWYLQRFLCFGNVRLPRFLLWWMMMTKNFKEIFFIKL